MNTTKSPGETKFLLPDGTRLKGEGEHQDMVAPHRLADVLQSGAIRYRAVSGVNPGAVMTEEQAQIIADDWNTEPRGPLVTWISGQIMITHGSFDNQCILMHSVVGSTSFLKKQRSVTTYEMRRDDLLKRVVQPILPLSVPGLVSSQMTVRSMSDGRLVDWGAIPKTTRTLHVGLLACR